MLFPEGDGTDYSDRDITAFDFSGLPSGHPGNDSHSLAVEGGFDPPEHADMADRAVGINNERTHYAPFHAPCICFDRVSAGLIDEIDQLLTTTGELGFFLHEIILVDLHVALCSVRGDA